MSARLGFGIAVPEFRELLVTLEITTGFVAGEPVPCISRSAQCLQHSGYLLEEKDFVDLERLGDSDDE